MTQDEPVAEKQSPKKPKTSRLRVVLLLVLGLGAVAGLAMYLLGDGEREFTVAITVESEPDGADVYIDGERIGSTPLTLHRPETAPMVMLELRAPGHEQTFKTITPRWDQTWRVEMPPIE